MNKKLYLHIGCGKTGSSALQVWLDHCRADLLRQGIDYPQAGRDRLDEYEISSGNAGQLIQAIRNKNVASCLKQVFSAKSEHVLYSSEQFQGMAENQLIDLREECRRNLIDVVIIAYIRDLYDWAYSSYLQGVKRHAYAKNFEDYLKSRESLQPIVVVKKYLSVFPNVKLLHYDTEYTRGLDKSFTESLGLEVSSLPEMRRNTVNRSLTVEEASLMMAFNKAVPLKGEQKDSVQGRAVSDELIYQAPEKQTEIYYSPSLEGLLRERFQIEIDWINDNYLRAGQLKIFNPTGKRLSECGPQESPTLDIFFKALIVDGLEKKTADKNFGLNSIALKNQNIKNIKILMFLFRLVCRVLGIRYTDIVVVKNPDSLNATAELNPAHFTFINTLRNEALRRENVSLEDAFVLMKAAAIFRKNGPVIQKKIREYKEKMTQVL